MRPATDAPEQHPLRRGGLVPVLALGLGTLGCICVLSSLGHVPAGTPGGGALAGILTAVATLLQSGLMALAYLLGGIGLGRLPARFLARDSGSRPWLQAALGLGLMLWLSHLLGCAGLLSGDGALARIVAWTPVVIGMLFLLDQMARGELAPEKWPILPGSAALAAPALGVLFVAAVDPPGWLWESEFGAYDTMSYHLQLPKEWAAGLGALHPVQHNVYSFLPGYVEAAYLHLGQMMLGGDGVAQRMLGGEGAWVYSCQLLHSLMGVLAALLCGRAAWATARTCGATAATASLAGLAAGILVLSTGWTIVCASLAYNEMGVVALAAGAMLMCIDRRSTLAQGAPDRPWLTASGVGLLIGVASSCKPTALLLIGPAAAILLLNTLRGRTAGEAVKTIIAGCIGGLIAIIPWLVRNALAAGNPVFPFAAETLGLGHWTVEQASRYAKAHTYDGTLVDRLSLLFSIRGWLHLQWGATPLLALAAGLIAMRSRDTRRLAILLFAGTACGVMAWMFFTHLQSRFLLPLIVPLAMLLGVGFAAFHAPPPSRPSNQPGLRLATFARRLVHGLLLMLSLIPALLFLMQRGGAPNALLVGGVAEFTGMLRADEVYLEHPPAQRAAALLEAAGPFELVNLAIQPATLGSDTRAALLGEHSDLPPGEPQSVYLLGDATPLYFLAATGSTTSGVIYHTTWDSSPIGDAIRLSPDDPAAWTDHLRSRGIGFVLVSFDELLRLTERDRNFDPAVTIARVDAWLGDPGSRCSIVKEWAYSPDRGERARPGRVLVRLGGPGRGGTD